MTYRIRARQAEAGEDPDSGAHKPKPLLSTGQDVASSRRRIQRGPPISGGSEDGLRAAIRARFADGTLPRISGRAWAGTAQGDHRCACCLKTIRASGPEYEVGDFEGLHAHVECFSIWLAESNDGLKTDR